MPRDDATLLDISHAVERILVFAKGYDKRAFLRDEKTQAAVLHEIIIGEAAGQVRPCHSWW